MIFIFFKLLSLIILSLITIGLLILGLFIIFISFSFKDINLFLLENPKLRDEFFIKVNEVYEKLLEENIGLKIVKFSDCIYGKHCSRFTKINKHIFNSYTIDLENNNLICNLSGDIYFTNLYISKSDYEKMLKQL